MIQCRHLRFPLFCGLLLVQLWIAGPTAAATLFGIVSERSGGVLAAGAEQFLDAHPDHEITLRTTEQIGRLSDRELTALWRQADVVLLAAVFGDAVPRLQRLLTTVPPEGDLIAFNGDRRLTRLSRWQGTTLFAGLDPSAIDALHAHPPEGRSQKAHRARLASEHPRQAPWLRARAYWQGRGSRNAAALLAWLLKRHDTAIEPTPPTPQAAIRYYHEGRVLNAGQVDLAGNRPVVAILDHDTGDQAGRRNLLDALCRQLTERGLQCLAALARWGGASARALEGLRRTVAPAPLAAVISLQDFVVGGGDAREQAARALKTLDVPVLKGIRLTDRTAAEWRLSDSGLPRDSVHYRVAMPEVQGIGQPLVLAAATPPRVDPRTGLEVSGTAPLKAQVAHMAERAHRWNVLREKPAAEKRVAIVYYNHPPGRHNIGADNLDVAASLWEILHRMRDAGYTTGALPESPKALLERMQERGVNLPEDRAALREMAPKVQRLAASDYREWFETLPVPARRELTDGPLGYLHAALRQAVDAGKPELGRTLLQRTVGDLHHLLEGLDHPARDRATDLLEQLAAVYRGALTAEGGWKQAERLIQALRGTGIETLRGWGAPPGKVMVHEGRMLLPGLRFGNVFIGPQPPRGWETDEELLHANTTIPPTHQYLGFYHWLHDRFQADAVVHLGRHSTYEFLPRRSVGLAADDYPAIVAGDIPGIYPYIVDGVGEGIQAKRRGLAVIVDHLTPPLQSTPLYDDLLELRQLVESYEAASDRPDNPARVEAVTAIREAIDRLELREELVASMQAELEVRGIRFEQVDDAMLVHEVSHYLTRLQEQFMPRGLHVFGRDWEPEAVTMMLESMGEEANREALTGSPAAEREALLAALEGRYVHPGKGNDPVRTPEALPTGRNFHALDGGVLPTRVGYRLGARLAAEARRKNQSSPDGREAVVLWASDTVRDEGAMIGFALDMLGVQPVWNSRGIVKGLERVELEASRVRRDVIGTTSGLFRDLYPNLLEWIDRAVLLALDASSERIRRDYPALAPALDGALERLGDLSDPGNEPLSINRVAAHWVDDARRALEGGTGPADAGVRASLRLFGDAPGAYGAGVNRLVERSGAWKDRTEVGEAYLHRMGHAYGAGVQGVSAHKDLKRALAGVEHTYLGRASNLYGLIDNNDAFDYLGGLSLAVETLTGTAPSNHVIEHADPENPTMAPLEQALLSELRGRFLNPAWLKPLMDHDYAGARTMGSEFFEYLWGWQVTNPEIVRGWVWDEVKKVYMDDALDLGLDEFLEEGRNVHVKTNMLAVMLVAAQKGFWQPDQATLKELAKEFTRLVAEHGLPGSGHTSPDHPVMKFVGKRLDAQTRTRLQEVLAAARDPDPTTEEPVTTRMAEITPEQPSHRPQETRGDERQATPTPSAPLWPLAALAGLLLLGGLINGGRHART